MASDQRPTPWQYLISILGGALGVQSEATRQRDFTRANPTVLIAGGFAFLAVFVLILIAIVKLVVG